MPAPSAPYVLVDGPARSDAQRNRDRIIDVAQDALDADPDVSLRSIAKAAGVGQGTLYRHFPDREALLWAVYQREAEQLVGMGDELLERLPALAALREWMRRLGLFAVTNTNLGAAMHRTVVLADRPAGYTRCTDTVSTLIEANRTAGTVRPDLTVEDLLAALAGIWQINDAGPAARMARAERLIEIVIAGIATGRTAPG